MADTPMIFKALAFIFGIVAVVIAWADFWTMISIKNEQHWIDADGKKDLVIGMNIMMYMGPSGVACDMEFTGPFGILLAALAGEAGIQAMEADCANQIEIIAQAFQALVPWEMIIGGIALLAMFKSTKADCNCCKCTDCLCCNPKCCGIASSVFSIISVLTIIVGTGALGVTLANLIAPGLELGTPYETCADITARRMMGELSGHEFHAPSVFKNPIYSLQDISTTSFRDIQEIADDVMAQMPLAQRDQLYAQRDQMAKGRALATAQQCQSIEVNQDYLGGFLGTVICGVLFIICAIAVASKPVSGAAAPAGGDAASSSSS